MTIFAYAIAILSLFQNAKHMSKKYDELLKALQELLKKMGIDIDNLSEEQIEALQKMSEGNYNVANMMDDRWHDYPLPDYSKLSKPIAEWLQPMALFEDSSDIFEICEEAEKVASQMERQQVIDDLRNFIHAYLAYLYDDELETFDNYDNFKSLFSAFRLISRLNLTELLDDVLETLKQPYNILDHIYLSGNDFVGTIILHDIGKGQMDKLEAFLQESGYIPMAKPIVFDALAFTYKYEPALRLKALHHINNYLNRCLQIGLGGGDVSNVSHYANTLAWVHAKETLPLLRKIYESLYIPSIEIDGMEEVEDIMNNMEMELEVITPTTIDEALQIISEYDDDDEDWDDEDEDDEDWDEEDEEEEDDDDDEEDEEDDDDDEDDDEDDEDYEDDEDGDVDEDWDDEDDEDDEDEELDEDNMENLNFLFDPDFEMRQCQLQVTLQGTLHQMARLLKVPSNIYLDSLAQFILISLSWSETDTCWFETPHEIYTDIFPGLIPNNKKKKELFELDASILEDLFTPSKNKVTFIVKEGDTPWVFDIKLSKTDHYFEDDKSYVELLKAKGPAPASSLDTMEEYENNLAEGELELPDIESINKEMKDLEDSML